MMLSNALRLYSWDGTLNNNIVVKEPIPPANLGQWMMGGPYTCFVHTQNIFLWRILWIYMYHQQVVISPVEGALLKRDQW
jgi:hypothetical protein